MPTAARVVSPYVRCHTVSVKSHEIHAPSLGSGASVGGGGVEVVTRKYGVPGRGRSGDQFQWKLSVNSKNHTPSSANVGPRNDPQI